MKATRGTSDPRLHTVLCNTGYDESTGGKFGGLHRVDNMRLSYPQGTLKKRPGHRGITPTLVTGWYNPVFSRLPRRVSFLDACDGVDFVGNTNGLVYSVDASNVYLPKGIASTCEPVRYALSVWDGNGAPYHAPSVARTSSGDVCLSYCSGTDVRFVFMRDGRVVHTSDTTGTKAVVTAIGDLFFIAVQSSATQIDVYSATWQGLTSLDNPATLYSGAEWDLCSDGASHWWLAWQTTSTNVRIWELDTSGATLNTVNITVSLSAYALSLSWLEDVPNDTLWLGTYCKDTRVVAYAVYTAALVQVTAHTALFAPATDVYGPPLFGVWYDVQRETPGFIGGYAHAIVAGRLSNGSRAILSAVVGPAAVPIAMAVIGWGCVPVSKPDARGRFWVVTESDYGDGPVTYRYALLRLRQGQGGQTCFDVELSTELVPRVEGAFIPGNSSTHVGWFSAIDGGSTDLFPVVLTVTSSDDAPGISVRLVEYETSEDNPKKTSVPVMGTVVSSGQPSEMGVYGDAAYYPGSAEVGWIAAPNYQGSVLTGLVGTLLAGTYSYRAVWELVDHLGRRHLSAPSPPVTETVSGRGTLNQKWGQVAPTARSVAADTLLSRPRLLVYRTQGEGGVQGQQYHLAGAATGVTFGIGYLVFSDARPDSVVLDEDPVYTDGGVKPNALAPSCRFLARSADRLWCGGLLNRKQLQASKTFYPTEPITFADDDAWRVMLPSECTGLTVQDDTVVAFTAEGVYLVSGAGPDERGVGSFDTPRQYSNVGCPDAYQCTVVTTSIGTIYRSAGGYKLIPLGFGALQSIGDKISDAQQYTPVSAAYHNGPQGDEVRIVVTDGEDYWFLVFDCASGNWFKDNMLHNPDCAGSWSDGHVHASSALYGSGIHFYYQDSALQVRDGESGLSAAELVTAWQHPFGVGGHGRVNRVLLASEGVAVRYRVTIETDAGHTQTATLEFPSERTPYNYREIMLEHPPCGAFRVTCTELVPSGSVYTNALGFVSIMADCDDSDAIRPSDEGERS